MRKKQNKLPRKFYAGDLHHIAVNLLGKVFVKKDSSGLLSGKIVEVEAYDGSIDEASHSFRGMTKRNEVMFGDEGHLYVYFTYGMHFCCNVVTGKKGESKAILIRAIEPFEGISLMSQRRFGVESPSEKQFLNLSNGPAKICSAFDIGRKENGLDLTADEIYILDSPSIDNSKIVSTTRIGIKKSVDLPWRYYIKDNHFVSHKG